MSEDYFNERMVNRQRLLWTIATRRQLERWEPIVAAALLADRAGRQLNGADVWAAAIEHHLALVAGRNLLWALDLPPLTTVPIDDTLRDELREGRDLHEHWVDNVPVFNVRPRVKEPAYPSGRAFAERNPGRSPYWWLGWSNKTGARLLPHVSAPALHELLDAVESEVLGRDAALGDFVPERAPSPWVYENGEWWPKADDATGRARLSAGS